MKRYVALFTLLIVCVAAPGFLPALAQKEDPGSQVTAKFHRASEKAIPNHYIAVLDQDADGKAGDLFKVAEKADKLMSKSGGKTTNIYANAINGFSAQMTEQEALELSKDERVAFVEEDSIMEANATQTNPPWGLDRIGQTNLPLNQTYSYTATGSGVNVYVIDTGIRRTHTHSSEGAHLSVLTPLAMARIQMTVTAMHARLWNDRRFHIRRRKGCSPVRSARSQLQRFGQQCGGHCGSRLGNREPYQSCRG
jgi:subtilisin family serine protease